MSLPIFAELSDACSCGATKKIPARDRKSQNPVDADSTLTHVGESSVHVTSFAFRVILLQFPGDAAMYYGIYLFAIALVIMIGQLAFALYQVANLLFLS